MSCGAHINFDGKTNQWPNNYLWNIPLKPKDRKTQTPLKPGVISGGSEE